MDIDLHMCTQRQTHIQCALIIHIYIHVPLHKHTHIPNTQNTTPQKLERYERDRKVINYLTSVLGTQIVLNFIKFHMRLSSIEGEQRKTGRGH